MVFNIRDHHHSFNDRAFRWFVRYISRALRNHYSRGRANYALKKYDEAIEDYTAAIELLPDTARYYTNRANAYEAAGDDAAAAADRSRADELNEN